MHSFVMPLTEKKFKVQSQEVRLQKPLNNVWAQLTFILSLTTKTKSNVDQKKIYFFFERFGVLMSWINYCPKFIESLMNFLILDPNVNYTPSSICNRNFCFSLFLRRNRINLIEFRIAQTVMEKNVN